MNIDSDELTRMDIPESSGDVVYGYCQPEYEPEKDISMEVHNENKFRRLAKPKSYRAPIIKNKIKIRIKERRRV